MSKKKLNTEDVKPVKLNDGFGTVIYIPQKANPEKAIAKYLKDIEDYNKASVMNFNKGRTGK